jgi:hypothetical protein
VVRLYLKNKAKKGCGCGSSGRDEQGSKFNSQYYKKKKNLWEVELEGVQGQLR